MLPWWDEPPENTRFAVNQWPMTALTDSMVCMYVFILEHSVYRFCHFPIVMNAEKHNI